VQKASNSERYTAPSETFRLYVIRDGRFLFQNQKFNQLTSVLPATLERVCQRISSSGHIEGISSPINFLSKYVTVLRETS
jgi:hypothetical protein